MAGIGPVSMSTGSTPTTATAWTRAIGRQPRAAATSLVVTSSAPAPSEICEALPAVTVPPSSNAGFSPASTAAVVPGRMPSSCGHRRAAHRPGAPSSRTAPSSSSATGTISSAKAPAARAAAARRCDSTL